MTTPEKPAVAPYEPEHAAAEPLPAERLRRMLWIAAAIFAVLFVVGIVPRLRLRRDLRTDAEAERQRVPTVSTVRPHRAADALAVPLPGNVQAILETGVYARTDGYLKTRYVDIGDHVHAGQLLAEIDTPEVDQQLNQAIATLNESKANVVKLEADLALARTTLQRYVIAGVGTVSKQQIDERTAGVTDAEKAVDAARATVNANEANVHRLLDLQGFQKVYASFDGIITARSVDQGALISAGSGGGMRELFRLAQVDVLRILVYVPQSYSPDVKVGQKAAVGVRELPRRTFDGTVTRTAGAIDPTSRTMLTEVQVPNPEGLLLAGSYATVTFQLARTDPPLVIPSSALLVDAQGVRVATVAADGTLHYQPIEIGRDYGTEVEILSGLDESATVATGIGSTLAEGSRVAIAEAASVAGGGAGASGAAPTSGGTSAASGGAANAARGASSTGGAPNGAAAGTTVTTGTAGAPGR